MKSWTLHSRPLNKKSMLDLTGVPDGGGIWAPDLSYDGKTVYLVYTNVRERGPMMQTENYLIMTDDINGEWSEPVYLNSLGFDPSLFHDDDGRKWLLSLDNHYRENQRFNGLCVQEYDPVLKRVVGNIYKIYTEPHGELVEGSHIYKMRGMYYLLKAQGGTGERHSAQLSRSESLFGPWEDDEKILLHSRDNPSLPLQKAGHADIVDTPEGEMYMVHLASRYSSDGHCIFGRETCIQKVEWTDGGWLRLSQGGENPHVEVPVPKGVAEPAQKPSYRFYDFTLGVISSDFHSLRRPLGNLAAFTENGLMLRGADGLNSRFDQALIARRIGSADAEVTARLVFEPDWEKHLAGLVFIYDTSHWHYLYVSRNNDTKAKELFIITCDNGKLRYPLKKAVKIREHVPVELRGKIDGDKLQFSYNDGDGFAEIEPALDINILSDEHVYLGFTGAMCGICCQDLFRKEKCAEFEWFEYKTGE